MEIPISTITEKGEKFETARGSVVLLLYQLGYVRIGDKFCLKKLNQDIEFGLDRTITNFLSRVDVDREKMKVFELTIEDEMEEDDFKKAKQAIFSLLSDFFIIDDDKFYLSYQNAQMVFNLNTAQDSFVKTFQNMLVRKIKLYDDVGKQTTIKILDVVKEFKSFL
jgi:hypothetical protein